MTDYKSGAVYDGKIEDNLKCGQGSFLWPNGDRYNGEFVDNHRLVTYSLDTFTLNSNIAFGLMIEIHISNKYKKI